MTVIVHHLENSRSQRILWLLEELGIDYQIVRYERDKVTMLARVALKKVHPLGKSPVIEDGGRAIAETGAIVEYLVERADGRFGQPAAADDALRYRHFLHYSEGSLMPPLFANLVLGRVPLLGKVAQRKFQPMIEVHLNYVDRELSQRTWFAGDSITAADVMMSYPLEAAASRVRGVQDRPHIAAWLQLIKARPAYQRALAAGGPYTLA